MPSIYDLAKQELLKNRGEVQRQRSDRFRALLSDLLGDNPSDFQSEYKTYSIPITMTEAIELRLCKRQPYSLEFTAPLTGRSGEEFTSEPFEGRIDFAVQVDRLIAVRRAARSGAIGVVVASTTPATAQSETDADLIQIMSEGIPEFVNLATLSRVRFETIDGKRCAVLTLPTGEMRITGEDAHCIEDRIRGRQPGTSRLYNSH